MLDYYDSLPQHKEFWLLLALQRILKMQVKCLINDYGVDPQLEVFIIFRDLLSLADLPNILILPLSLSNPQNVAGMLWQAKVRLLELPMESSSSSLTKPEPFSRQGSLAPDPSQQEDLPPPPQTPGNWLLKRPQSRADDLDDSFLGESSHSPLNTPSQRGKGGISKDVDGDGEDDDEDAIELVILKSQQRVKEMEEAKTRLQQEQEKKAQEAAQQFYSQPKLYHTLVTCALALMYLRVPILLSDLRRWVRNGQLPYMSEYVHLPERLLSLLSENQRKTLQARVLFSLSNLSTDGFSTAFSSFHSMCPSKRFYSLPFTNSRGD